jgi:glycogen synthase kinase 3 beta
MRVRGTFLTKELRSEYLNIVMDFYEGDMYNFIKNKEKLSTMDIKIISYQIFRGLLYIHSLNICHRDIKPHNLIMHEGRVVICDFGSAKILDGGSNLSYICSRCYRAPELIFGSVNYGVHIDMWSAGCVLLEMIEGKPIFVGGSSVDQLIEIMKVLGTPSR